MNEIFPIFSCSRSRIRGANKGFSLVELLIGITVSTLIIGAVYAAYLGASRAWERSRIGESHYQSARVALDQIQRYVMAAVKPDEKAGVIFEGEAASIEGNDNFHADRLFLTSTGGKISGTRKENIDLAQVEFSLDAEKPEQGLVMHKRTVPINEDYKRAETDPLASEAVSFQARYFDGTEWADEWLEKQSLPVAVEVSLTFLDREKTLPPVKFTQLITLPVASGEIAE